MKSHLKHWMVTFLKHWMVTLKIWPRIHLWDYYPHTIIVKKRAIEHLLPIYELKNIKRWLDHNKGRYNEESKNRNPAGQCKSKKSKGKARTSIYLLHKRNLEASKYVCCTFGRGSIRALDCTKPRGCLPLKVVAGGMEYNARN